MYERPTTAAHHITVTEAPNRKHSVQPSALRRRRLGHVLHETSARYSKDETERM